MRNSGIILFVCAGLLLTAGAALGGSAGWSVLRMSYYFWVSDMGTELGAGVLLVAGAMLCLPACWLATLVPYHPRAISLLATLMFLSTAALLTMSAGLSALGGLSRLVREPHLVNASMYRALAHAQQDSSVRSAFASLQLELHCCGVQSYADWYKHRRTLPPACCNRWTHGKHDVCDKPAFKGGCLAPALGELRRFVNSMAILASVLIIILAVTMFAAAYTLVAGAVERGELAALKAAAAAAAAGWPQLRVACLHRPPAPELVSLVPAPPPTLLAPLPAPITHT